MLATTSFDGALRRSVLAERLRVANIVLVPSHSETYGLVALEAAASGVPVIAAATGGLREDALAIVLAPEWHGDINTQFWLDNACYEVDGPPMEMRHASDAAHHWNITARCIGHATEDNGLKPPVPPEGSRTWGT